MSVSFSPSWLITKHWICTSSMNPSRLKTADGCHFQGRSMFRMVRISRSLGAPSRLRKPPMVLARRGHLFAVIALQREEIEAGAIRLARTAVVKTTDSP